MLTCNDIRQVLDRYTRVINHNLTGRMLLNSCQLSVAGILGFSWFSVRRSLLRYLYDASETRVLTVSSPEIYLSTSAGTLLFQRIG